MSTAIARPSCEALPADAPDVATLAVALARSQAPLRRVLCAISGRLVAARAWERLGYARLADYARERAGLSARQVYELAHMEGAFVRVPRLGEAFGGGEIDWSRACLLARVVTPENVEAWLARAGELGVRALSREVGEVREADRRAAEAAGSASGAAGAGGLDATAEGARETVVFALARPARARWARARLLVSRLAGHHASPAEAAEAVVAEVCSAIRVEVGTPERSASSVPGGDWELRCRPDAANRRARPAEEALPRVPAAAEEFLAGLTEGLEGADAFELDTRLRRTLRLEQQRLARLAPLLREIAEARLYREFGFASFSAFAREWLGLAPRVGQALLRLERAGGRCAALGEAWRAGRLSWVQAHRLLPLLLRGEVQTHAAAWVAHAQQVTVLRLEEDVDLALATGELDPAALARLGGPEGARMSARPPGAPRERATLFALYGVPVEVAQLLRAALATVQRRLERRLGRGSSQSEAFEAMLEHALATWSAQQPRVPREHRVFARDGWRCAVPGCSSYSNLHAHHIRYRSRGGADALSNLVTLCAWHHLRGVHAGVVRVSGEAPDRLRFGLGIRDDGSALARYESGDRVC